MVFNTKFNVGDSFVWKNGRHAKNRRVKKIIIDADGIFYQTFTPHGSYYIDHPEKECFSTTEECNLVIIEEIAGGTNES